MPEWFVYILHCADSSLYTGITPDLEKRIQLHNAKKGAKYTRGRLPVRMVYSEKCANKSEASKREAFLKKLTRSAKLQLISEGQRVG